MNTLTHFLVSYLDNKKCISRFHINNSKMGSDIM